MADPILPLMIQVQSLVPASGPHKRPKGRPKKFHEWDPMQGVYVYNPQLKEQQKLIDEANRYNPEIRVRPKRAVTSFILFMTDTRKRFAVGTDAEAVAFRGLGFADSQRVLAKLWKDAPAEVREQYKARAEVERARYMAAVQAMKPPKKTRKRQDPNRLKRPPSSFLLFCQTRRDVIQAAYPGMPMREITKMMGQEWKMLPKSHKAQFGHQAYLLLEEYRAKVAQMQVQQLPQACQPEGVGTMLALEDTGRLY